MQRVANLETLGAIEVEMDKKAALEIAHEQLAPLRDLAFDELWRRAEKEDYKVSEVTREGVRYHVGINYFVDDAKSRTVRVLLGIHDGGWRAFLPLTVSFIKAPDGSFVDE